jgi:hypothetical protein
MPGFLDPDDRYALLSNAGNPLERLALVVSFEAVRSRLEKALKRTLLSGRTSTDRKAVDCRMTRF